MRSREVFGEYGLAKPSPLCGGGWHGEAVTGEGDAKHSAGSRPFTGNLRRRRTAVVVLRTPLIRQNVLTCRFAHFATFPHYGGKVRRCAAVGAFVHGKSPVNAYCVPIWVVGAIINRPAGSSPITTRFRRIRTDSFPPRGSAAALRRKGNGLPHQ